VRWQLVAVCTGQRAPDLWAPPFVAPAAPPTFVPGVAGELGGVGGGGAEGGQEAVLHIAEVAGAGDETRRIAAEMRSAQEMRDRMRVVAVQDGVATITLEDS